ncbi:hypothetical protein ACUN0C_17540 [Faunimonas sp. B44]
MCFDERQQVVGKLLMLRVIAVLLVVAGLAVAPAHAFRCGGYSAAMSTAAVEAGHGHGGANHPAPDGAVDADGSMHDHAACCGSAAPTSAAPLPPARAGARYVHWQPESPAGVALPPRGPPPRVLI